MSSTTSYPSLFIDTCCTLQERFAPTAYRATFPNGKSTVAFVQRKEEHLLQVLQPGDRVRVTVSPASFERARIRARWED